LKKSGEQRGNISMRGLDEFYAAVGADADDVVRRLGVGEKLVVRFVLRYRDDGTFNKLVAALDDDDTEEAFRAAHTLKGSTGTLGFERLYREASTVTEMLRRGELKAAKAAVPVLEAEYREVIAALNRLDKAVSEETVTAMAQ
jgi:histidine phosphotransfer protein HptB